MVAADLDEGAGDGWGDDAALVLDEGTLYFIQQLFIVECASYDLPSLLNVNTFISIEGGFGEEGTDGDILGGDEEGGWDVGDEDLVLPPDLVSLYQSFYLQLFILFNVKCNLTEAKHGVFFILYLYMFCCVYFKGCWSCVWCWR